VMAKAEEVARKTAAKIFFAGDPHRLTQNGARPPLPDAGEAQKEDDDEKSCTSGKAG
jgi:hypothetical protein